ncbi:MAG: phytanoyl-CoA dioxygenase family protein [Planctomycetes bacterium]|nr:phytanoyl-CoA dioxygenase family protein [Planctomycetota bacterium]
MITNLLPKHVPNIPPATQLEHHLAQLEADGFTVLPGFLDHATTRALRDHIDALAGPVRPAHEPAERRIHDLRHPIPGEIMAEMVTPQHLELARMLFDAQELRLTEQVLIRTDPATQPPGPVGWHIDFAFHPRHYAARPRQTYVQMVHALSTVESGGAATMVVPGSHHLILEAARRLSEPMERTDCVDQVAFKDEVMRTAGVDLTRGIEILPNEGDLVLFHPTCVHSGSRNTRAQARYVMFMSFFDVSATDLNAYLRSEKYRDRFPDSLRDHLPPEMRSLLDR